MNVVALGGDLDIIVNAHGIQRRHSAEVFPIEEWDEVLNVNLNSVFILCQEAAKIMLKKGYGKIINIASMVSWILRIKQRGVHLCCHITRRDRIDVDASCNPVIAEFLGELCHAALCCCVSRNSLSAKPGYHRCDVDGSSG